MPVIENEAVKHFALPGLNHRTLADAEYGMKNLEVWAQTIEAGAGTPVHSHACEEAIVILEGHGNADGQRRGEPLRSQFDVDYSG
jgi:quercetin dioxygenase-like cupin family protein